LEYIVDKCFVFGCSLVDIASEARERNDRMKWMNLITASGTLILCTEKSHFALWVGADVDHWIPRAAEEMRVLDQMRLQFLMELVIFGVISFFSHLEEILVLIIS
jgi:hypothetical protein